MMLIAGCLVVGACAEANQSAGSTPSSTAPAITVPATTAPATTVPATTVPEDYPDAITRALDRLANSPRPVESSAMPPRHLDAEAFPVALVDRSLIVSGGPPPDGIPPIDAPRYEVAHEVDWLAPNEPVLALLHDGQARAYPVQVMIWHEIVNDALGDLPVTVTYCPLCDSGVAFDRRLSDDVLDFGTSGGLYQANLVMYDRQTESLWTQFDGRAVIGTRVGERLTTVPIETMSWGAFRRDHPEGTVLSRDDVAPKPYGRNPYHAYDQRDTPVPGFYTGEPDDTLAPYERVVGVDFGAEVIAVPTRVLADAGVAATRVTDRLITFWHLPGTASAVNADDIADGEDIGSTAVFVAEVDGRPAVFTRAGEEFVDDVTGTSWNILGEAVAGPRSGDRLVPVGHVDTFWFAWATYHADGAVLDLAGVSLDQWRMVSPPSTGIGDAVDEARARQAQVERHVGHLLGLAVAAQRHAAAGVDRPSTRRRSPRSCRCGSGPGRRS